MSSKSPSKPPTVSFTSTKMSNKPVKAVSSRLANAAGVNTFGSRPPTTTGRTDTLTRDSGSHAPSRANSVARSSQSVRSGDDRDIYDVGSIILELPSEVKPRPRHASDGGSFDTAKEPSPRKGRDEGVSGMTSRRGMDPSLGRHGSSQVDPSSRGIALGKSGLVAMDPDSHAKVTNWMSAMGNGERVAKFDTCNDEKACAQVLNTGFMLNKDQFFGPPPSVAQSVDRLSNCDLTAIGHPLQKTPSHLEAPKKLAEDPMVECDATIYKEEIESLKKQNAYLYFHYEEYAKYTQAAWEERFRNAAAECTKQMSRVVQENVQLREKLGCYEQVVTDQKKAIQECLAFFPDLETCLRDEGFSFSRTLQLNVNREQNFQLNGNQRLSWQEAQQKLYGLVSSGGITPDRLKEGNSTDLAPASASSVSSSKARMVLQDSEKSFDADSFLTGSGSSSKAGSFSPDVGGENCDGEFDPVTMHDAPVFDLDMKRGTQLIDTSFMDDFHEYFFAVVDSPTFAGTRFIQRLLSVMFERDGLGTDMLDEIVSDIHFQWTSLRMEPPITFENVMDFLKNVTLSPFGFDEDLLVLFKSGEGSRVGAIRETCPFEFSADLVDTCLDWRSAPELFWAVSAEHYLNWNTTTSKRVRALLCGGPAKK